MTYTNEQVKKALQDAVALKGEHYIYFEGNAPLGSSSACVYADANGNPSCIVGHVIAALDPEGFEKVIEFDVSEWNDGDTSATNLFKTIELGFSAQQASVLIDAQVSQDGGKTWGATIRPALWRLSA